MLKLWHAGFAKRHGATELEQSMTRFLLLYAAVALVLFPLDALWLGVVARKFYTSQMGDLLLAQPRFAVAGLFYAFYVVGIVVFAVEPALRDAEGATSRIWLSAAMAGAFLGLIAYGTYDATNYATLKGFPLMVALVDCAWGVVLTAVSAGLGTIIATRLFGVSA
jgi:uncharacterized membrane protein